MRILITGANGQLGQELTRCRVSGSDIIGVDRTQMNVTSFENVRDIITDVRPDAIIHAAAFTAVDLAEACPDDAHAVNAAGTRNVAVAAEAIGARLCYVSTDYVFDGQGTTPYGEYDHTDPRSVYGKSKRAGELLVQSLCSRWFVVRTSWVYGKYGSNFVQAMLTKSRELPKLRVVHDQVGAPTYTRDLSELLLKIVETEKYGIYHASNTGTCSWYEFACAIFEEAHIDTQIEPCTTAEFPRPAPRPRYSVLEHTALRVNGFTLLRPWREALVDYLREVQK